MRHTCAPGVTLRDPASTYIDDEVTIGRDTELGPGVCLRGRCTIGARCLIDAGSVLSGVTVADDTHIKPHTVATDAVVGDKVALGPFSHLRPGSVLCPAPTSATLSSSSRRGSAREQGQPSCLPRRRRGSAPASTSAAAITCNYDGVNKHKTVIEDDVFVRFRYPAGGAPVRVGKGRSSPLAPRW